VDASIILSTKTEKILNQPPCLSFFYLKFLSIIILSNLLKEMEQLII